MRRAAWCLTSLLRGLWAEAVAVPAKPGPRLGLQGLRWVGSPILGSAVPGGVGVSSLELLSLREPCLALGHRSFSLCDCLWDRG